MLITKTSPISKEENTLDLPVTQEQLDEYEKGGGFVQTIFPTLSQAQREFIKTGITPEEWEELFH